jgi:hypothetical protein
VTPLTFKQLSQLSSIPQKTHQTPINVNATSNSLPSFHLLINVPRYHWITRKNRSRVKNNFRASRWRKSKNWRHIKAWSNDKRKQQCHRTSPKSIIICPRQKHYSSVVLFKMRKLQKHHVPQLIKQSLKPIYVFCLLRKTYIKV